MKPSLLSLNLGLLTLLASVHATGAMREYAATADTSNWQMVKTSRLECQLNHEVPYYGEAIFSTAASKNKDVNFNLDMVVRPDNCRFKSSSASLASRIACPRYCKYEAVA